jgi:hypothetical protein
MAFLLPALASLGSSLLPGLGRVVSSGISGLVKGVEGEFTPAETGESKFGKQVNRIQNRVVRTTGLDRDLEAIEDYEDEEDEEEEYRKKQRKQKKNLKSNKSNKYEHDKNVRTVHGKNPASHERMSDMIHNKRSKRY